AHLKTSRGMRCLACLLRRPGKECHVLELLVHLPMGPVACSADAEAIAAGPAIQTCDLCPMLDPQAKVQYKRRIEELRADLKEAEQFNDPERAAGVRAEMNMILEHVAAAVGLGGRNRPTGSQAERARSAITKRIKDAIERIAAVNPALG